MIYITNFNLINNILYFYILICGNNHEADKANYYLKP